MKYAIIEASGKQIWIKAGRFYDFNYIPGEPGDLIKLKRVLIFNEEGNVKIGHPCLNDITVKARILRHIKGKKITILKAKPKKNNKSKRGHRQKLTRLLIEEITTASIV
uniref:ribosomal protein L21 n=1 Tax=Catenella fusiformis TaxID=3024791 RepID=UPI0027DA4265|nr:ribosomal protein L21 [Catenella fusiformis]WCH57435.1 ribosomal protein L21 [Catenella fusiformis]